MAKSHYTYKRVSNIEDVAAVNWSKSDREVEPLISEQVIREIKKEFDAIEVDSITKEVLRERYFQSIVDQSNNLRIHAKANSVVVINSEESKEEIKESDPTVYFNFLYDIESKRKSLKKQFGKMMSWRSNRSIDEAFNKVLNYVTEHVKKSQPAFAKLCKSYLDEPKIKIRGARWSQTKAGCGIVVCGLWTPIQYGLTCGNCRGNGSCRKCCDSTYHGGDAKTRLPNNNLEVYHETELKDGKIDECAPRNSIYSLWDTVETAKKVIAEENRKLTHLGPAVQKMA